MSIDKSTISFDDFPNGTFILGWMSKTNVHIQFDTWSLTRRFSKKSGNQCISRFPTGFLIEFSASSPSLTCFKKKRSGSVATDAPQPNSWTWETGNQSTHARTMIYKWCFVLVCRCIYLCVYLSINLSTYLYLNLYLYLSLNLFFYFPMFLFVYLSIYI